MKILLAVNGAQCGIAAARAIAGWRAWPAGSELRVIAVAEMPVMLTVGSYGALPEFASAEFCDSVEKIILENARAAMNMALMALEDGCTLGFKVTGEVIKGFFAQSIVDEAERWGADLIVIGSSGHRDWHNIFRGDVAMSVAKHAQCSVEIVKFAKASIKQDGPKGLVEREVPDAPSYSC